MHQYWQSVLLEWQGRKLPQIIDRGTNLNSYLSSSVKKIISVVGFRRTGKTFSLFELAQKIGQQNCLYVSFEDERLPKQTPVLTSLTDTITELFPNRKFILLLDEIQNIPDWSLWARRIHESTDHQLFISGSSSRLLSTELPTELRGRSLSVIINPLGFKEFLRFKQQDPGQLAKPKILSLLREFLYFGGFPEIVLAEEGKKPLILDEYYQTFLSKDVIERFHIRQTQTLKQLIQLLLNSPYFTASKLTNNLKGLDLQASRATVARYVNYLQENFFLHPLSLHTPGIRNRLKAERKTYFVDSSFLARFSTAFSQNIGRLMEQAVFSRLFLQSDIYYWKDHRLREIDFVTRNMQIITWDLETDLKNGISCVPLYKFLLS
ncbi:MAG: hypothetical protein UY06_C0043G0002 [Candidatus Amesbacteria bacterium GW2011_GWA2_47_70]|nr:MAG: hypothetical protein UY06_C0043G0002 [Candidatus Amesbacteria bacterium GW2011_GWA2_47_70]